MKGIIVSAIFLTLAGCAHTGKVTKVTPYHYQVTAMADPTRGGAAGAQTLALAEANKYCTSMNKEIFVTKVGLEDKDWGLSNVTFRCLGRDEQGYVGQPPVRSPDD